LPTRDTFCKAILLDFDSGCVGCCDLQEEEEKEYSDPSLKAGESGPRAKVSGGADKV
jgi:hypothetical protein